MRTCADCYYHETWRDEQTGEECCECIRAGVPRIVHDRLCGTDDATECEKFEEAGKP